jgi:hypothetical protein
MFSNRHSRRAPHTSNVRRPGKRERVKVVSREQERNRVCRAARGARQEYGSIFQFQFLSHARASADQRAQERTGALCQNTLVRNDQEFPGALWVRRRVQQVRFRSERNPAQVFERANGIGAQPMLGKQFPIMRRERQHHIAQIGPQLLGLKLPDSLLRQRLPARFEERRVHECVS